MSQKGDERFLIVPDVHQDWSFLEKIRRAESGDEPLNWVFLGDFFDAKRESFDNTESLKRTLQGLIDLLDQAANQVEILMGNHDLLYFLLARDAEWRPEQKAKLLEYYGYPDRAKFEILRGMDFDRIWSHTRMVTFHHGYLLSHAGLTREYWDSSKEIDENLEDLNRLLEQPFGEDHELKQAFRAGLIRGGDLAKGGPLWLDWNHEFSDELPLPQIVAHTAGSEWRRNTRSYCLDAVQSVYAILDRDGLHPKSL